MKILNLLLCLVFIPLSSEGAIKVALEVPSPRFGLAGIKPMKLSSQTEASPFIDVPVTYNKEVQRWVKHFSTKGKRWFKTWLERSHKYLPSMQRKLEMAGLPKDLAYIAMIESGFSARAISHASAVGPWQFMKPTGERFGLAINDWIDERRDFDKSTIAAISYMKVLHKEFDNWYLVAAAYNTGEGRVRRHIKKHKTRNFWELSRNKAFVEETRDYIPKFLAAVLISKAPHLYGFSEVDKQYALPSELFLVPGGTKLMDIAKHLKLTKRAIKDLNPELLLGAVPNEIPTHLIRVPKGATQKLSALIARNP